MKKVKFSEVFVSKYRFYLLITLLMLVTICVIKPHPITIISAVFVYFFILYITYRKRKSAIERIIRNLNSFMVKLNTDESILDFPLPALILNEQGEILWNNNGVDEIFKGVNKEKYIESLLKELNENFDDSFTGINRNVTIHGKHYSLLGNMVNIRKRGYSEKSLMLYFIDRDDFYELYQAYEDEQDVVGLILVDNYDEVIQGSQDSEKAQLIAAIETRLREWFSFTGGMFVKLDRNKFLISFDYKYLKQFVDNKFDILDSIKTTTFSNNMPITLSIALVIDNATKAEKLHNAFATLDIALGRGGDQAIIKRDAKYEFFGGKSKEIEKRTKVKSRVIAGALQELITESKNVCIIGHRNPDADCLGSALGIYRIAKSLGKDAYILFNGKGIALDGLVKRLNKDKAYDDVFVSTEEMLKIISPDTLLVVTDTHRNDYVEAPEILEKTNKVVLIDHHRRSADFIQDPTLTFHEVYASSACELVTEIMQYIDAKMDIPLVEAEALYAGILTDTKNFTFKTGVRTFEAAAFLKRLGVDVFAVKKLFDNDIDTYVAVADIIRTAEKVRSDVAIAFCPPEITNGMQIAAQAADELISLNGIETSFVLVNTGEYINISGRSNGSMNVQVVLEKLGGGGHQTVAGAQVYDANMEKARDLLLDAIKQSEEDNEK
ncbi:MAG: DHH family phosphoesterase [Clostridia bacterium]|nr:DHH family phosphoesterase [Clostridia bacterium]